MSSPWIRTSARLTVSQLQVGLQLIREKTQSFTSVNVPLRETDQIVANVFEHDRAWRLVITQGGNRVRFEEYKGEARCRSKAKAWIANEVKALRSKYASEIDAATSELRARGYVLK